MKRQTGNKGREKGGTTEQTQSADEDHVIRLKAPKERIVSGLVVCQWCIFSHRLSSPLSSRSQQQDSDFKSK